MAAKLGLAIIFCAFATISAVQVCHQPFGCYSLDKPWWSLTRPFAVLPKAPEVINTRMLLYTRNERIETELVINQTGILELSDYKGSRGTKIIIHGFLHDGLEGWVAKMTNELLKSEDLNVIAIQWGDGAKLPYMQATANARVVGDQVRHLIEFLERETETDPRKIHIIGQGMGSHIAGYAGKKTKVGRISALDPAGPYFDSNEKALRLDKEDADFVDVIHTDASSLLLLGLGMDTPIGHVDFYPNLGRNQPGCGNLGDRLSGTIWSLIKINLIGAQQALACSHTRAIDLYTESINTICPDVAFPCKSSTEYERGTCQKCDHGRCSRFGYHSNEFTGRGRMYLSTNAVAPFCLDYNFITNITTSSTQKSAKGEIYARINGKSGKTTFARLNGASKYINKDTTYSSSVDGKVEMGNVTSVDIKYVDGALLIHDNLVFDRVTVSTLDKALKSKTLYFCAQKTTVRHKNTVNLTPSSKPC